MSTDWTFSKICYVEATVQLEWEVNPSKVGNVVSGRRLKGSTPEGFLPDLEDRVLLLAILPTGAGSNRWKITVKVVFAYTCTWRR